jgi:polyisoprenoid-binding protein YceI
MKATFTTLCVLTAFAGIALAAPDTFDFKDPKNGNDTAFKLVAPKETIEGHANGVTGTVQFDPANPAATKGKIVVASKSLTVPNGLMKTHLHSATWLEVDKYPEISFEVKELKNVKTDGDKINADAVGTFKMKDASKDMTIPVMLTHLKDKLAERMPGKKGDLLVVRSTFSILRSDFNVNAHKNEDKVADKIDLSLGIAGAAAK